MKHPVSRRFGRATGITILAVALLTFFASNAVAVSLDPGEGQRSATVDPEFASTGIDASQLSEKVSGPFDFGRPRLVNLAKALAPSYLRLSGTKIDETYYDPTNTLTDALHPLQPKYNYVMRQEEWDAANEFAKAAGFKMMAAVNGGNGPRDLLTDEWDPANARAFIQRAVDKGYPIDSIMFGNEPNQAFVAGHRPAPAIYGAAEYDRDVTDFLKLKNELIPNTKFIGPGGFFTTGGERALLNSKLGPDISEIMNLSGSKYDAVTYHQYPAFAKAGKCLVPPVSPLVPADTLSSEFLDRDKGSFEYMSGLRDQYSPGKPLWIDESGSAACGGVVGYSDTYASSFYYLNSLGYLSQNGLGLTTRWTLSGPQPYALIDDSTLTPRPDYWATVLWKKLMGDVALAPVVTDPDPDVRIYSHCLVDGAPGGNTPGAVASLVLNTSHDSSKTIDLGSGTAASAWVMTSALDSGDVSLNGTKLVADVDGNVPPMDGVPVAGGSLTIPAASYAFVTTPDAHSEACGYPHPDTKTIVRLKVKKLSLGKLKKSGKIPVQCSLSGAGTSGTCSVEATVSRSQARKLKIGGRKPARQTRIGAGKATLKGPGYKSLVVKLSGRARKALKKSPKKFRPKIRLTATGSMPEDAFSGTASVSLKLKR